MLKQLRRNFILINMLLVSLVLLVVLTVQMVTAWRQVTAQSEEALRRAVLWGESGPDRWQVGGAIIGGDSPLMVPVFCVIFNWDGTVSMVLDNYVEITDATLSQAVSAALIGGEDQGILKELDLRYLRAVTGGSLRIAFADMGWERSDLSRQLLTSLLVLAAALVGFFLISLFLSQWALRPIEKSWQQQRQFVADASHELKTPLTVLLADADILLAHPEQTIDSQRKWVEYIQDEARRMKELVEDLLFLARNDSAAEKERKRQPVVLSDVCWNCMLSFEPVAFERGAQVNGDIDPEVRLLGDEGQLRRLVTILLDNACKYCGPEGTVDLSLKRSGDRAVLTVHNTGEPIPPEALPHLFERFYRQDSARARETGGYGLGLAIAASVVERHRGKISVTSTAAEGTTFTVSLPTEHERGIGGSEWIDS